MLAHCVFDSALFVDLRSAFQGNLLENGNLGMMPNMSLMMGNMGGMGNGSMVMMSSSFSSNGREVHSSTTTSRIGPGGVAEIQSQVYPSGCCSFPCVGFLHVHECCGLIVHLSQVRDGRTGQEKIVLERRLGEKVTLLLLLLLSLVKPKC